jgi:DNA recombination protein RmuC
MLEITMLAAGLVVGAVAAWLLRRTQAAHAAAQARTESESARMVLAERLQARDVEVQRLADEANGLRTDLQQVQTRWREESLARVAAEEKNGRIPELEAELARKEETARHLQKELLVLKTRESELETTLIQEKKAAEEKLALLQQAEAKLSHAFEALSSDALRRNNQSFLELAKTTLEKFQEGAQTDLSTRQKAIDDLVKPLQESLQKVDGKISELEKTRATAEATLAEQVKSLVATQTHLHTETANLVKALRAPQVRGRWGEIQLKRVVEMVGMAEHCGDFSEQASVTTEEGRLRPDLIVRLPGGKNIVIDAKCPLQSYLDALETTDPVANAGHLKNHARQVKDHISKLGAKGYWEQFTPAPEFVVMFLPGETFFSAALEQDSTLIEFGDNQRVILATPTTLIALLRAVAYGWRQEKLAENAQHISDLGRDLYKRLADLSEHWTAVGRSLGAAVNSYNKACGTLESRVLVSARRFTELQAAQPGAELQLLTPVEQTPRVVQASEWGS